MLVHILGLKPSVCSDLSSPLREGYVRELVLTMLQRKELQIGKSIPGKGTECAKALH